MRKQLTQISTFGIITLAAFLAVRPAAAADAKPNLIFIFVDDQGYYDLGCYGATEVKTPRIDAMAEQGTRFTDYYAAAPICSPSRAGLLTGCYPRRVGNETWVHRADSRSGIHPDELTIAELLKSGGYATACIGKWHLGAAAPFHPNKRGFDYFYGFLGGGHDYFKIDLRQPVREGYTQALERNGKPAEFDGYLTTALSDDAVEFIESSQGYSPKPVPTFK